MKIRSVLCAGLLALGVGCGSEVSPFIGTYEVSGMWTIRFADQEESRYRSYQLIIREGIGSDLLLEDELGCKLPADVDVDVDAEGDGDVDVQGSDNVAVIPRDATCVMTAPSPLEGYAFNYRVISGTVRRENSRILLECTGVATLTDPSDPRAGDLSLSMELVKDGS